MYIPSHFSADSPELPRQIIEQYSFATMITAAPTGMQITHLPVMLDCERGEHGTLRAHMARANPHWKFLDQGETVFIFQGPHSYVSPTWYREHFSVPTWNYSVVHCYGKPELLDEERSIQSLSDLLVRFEGAESTYDFEAAEAYTRKSIKGIVAFEMEISRLEAKFKMSQNKPYGDRLNVIEHLSQSEDQMSRETARLMGESLI